MRRWAIAVQHPDGDLRLFWRIRRSDHGEIFLVFAAGQDYEREGGIPFDPHTSWHKDGTVHSKSFNRKMGGKAGQTPDARFKGTEYGMGTSVDQMVSKKLPKCDPAEFDDVIEIKLEQLDSTVGRQQLHMDLIEPGIEPPSQGLGERALAQWVLKDASPWIVVSLYELPARMFGQAQ